MAGNKGKPSSNTAENKKDVGKKSDYKEIGATAGAKKKELSKNQPVSTSGGHSRK